MRGLTPTPQIWLDLIGLDYELDGGGHRGHHRCVGVDDDIVDCLCFFVVFMCLLCCVSLVVIARPKIEVPHF